MEADFALFLVFLWKEKRVQYLTRTTRQTTSSQRLFFLTPLFDHLISTLLAMVRFKTRWLLLAIDDKPLATTSPFPLAPSSDETAHASTSATILCAAQQRSSPGSGAATTLTPQLITRLLRASLVYNFGDVAAGAFGGVLTCKYYSTHTGTAIVRCSRDAARLVWASATMISSPVEMAAESGGFPLGGEAPSLRIRVVHCGGTIKKVQNKAIELDRKLIMRLRSKQKKSAANSTLSVFSDKSLHSTASAVEEERPIPVPIAIAPAVDDDEDLGEALDPDGGAVAVSTSATATLPQVGQQNQPTATATARSKDSSIDPEIQALLQQSRKQINSITM